MSELKDNHIDITLEYHSNQVDVRVPDNVTLNRLTELLGQILNEQGVSLPPTWHLELKNTTINLGGLDYLNDYPVGDGSTFQIIED
jgi:uncharacterized ubiquitin-like protein YukD